MVVGFTQPLLSGQIGEMILGTVRKKQSDKSKNTINVSVPTGRDADGFYLPLFQ